MKKLFILLLAAAAALAISTATPVSAQTSATESTVSLDRDFGKLYGTLTVPKGGSQTAVLIIAGSGPTDRNGNNTTSLRTDCYLQLARELEKAGIASLRYDKRGIGLSVFDDPTKMAEVKFDDFIGDVVAEADWLREQGFKRVVLAGHSEGALLALCAARRTSVSAVISIAGAGYPIDEILRLQLVRELVPNYMDLMIEAENIIDKLKKGERVDVTHTSPNLLSLFNGGIQQFMIGWMSYDPRKEIRALTIPVLIVNGDNDVQVPVDNADALAKAQPRAQKAIIEGMTHVLKHSDDRTLAGQAKTVYIDPSLPLDAQFVSTVTGFITSAGF